MISFSFLIFFGGGGCVGFGTKYGHVIHSLFLLLMCHFYRLSENFFTKCFAFIEEAQIGLWCQACFLLWNLLITCSAA